MQCTFCRRAPVKTTAYNRIAASLRDRALAGAWGEGGRLPTERALCRQFRTSRITIRRALQILEEEGLVDRRQGVGTFVRSNAVRRIPLMSSDFCGSIAAHAPDLERVLVLRREVPADAATAQVLNLSSGEPVLEAVRVDHLDDVPVATDRLLLVGSLSGCLTDTDLEAMNLLSVWARVQQLTLSSCTQSIAAVAAVKPVSTRLAVRGGTPLLQETNVVILAGGVRAGVIETHYRHDTFHFNATIDVQNERKHYDE